MSGRSGKTDLNYDEVEGPFRKRMAASYRVY
jgi:hypothetical protein